MPFAHAAQSIVRYNKFALHYNLVADAVYVKRHPLFSPFDPTFERYLIAALLAFDMGRMLGSGPRLRYDPEAGGFANRLHDALGEVKPLLESIASKTLIEVDCDECGEAIRKAYSLLAALTDPNSKFHVGATKILHFLNPDLFLIIDRNAARFLKREFDIPYRIHSRGPYSAELYLKAMKAVKRKIGDYGVRRFADLEPGTPMLRIFDKIAFATEGLDP